MSKAVFWTLTLSFFAWSCSTKMILRSEPDEATVYYLIPGSQEKKSLGTTPLEISSVELNKLTRLSPVTSDVLEIQFEKEGYSAKSIVLPYNSLFNLSTELELRLEVAKRPGERYAIILQHLTNAQTLINQAEFKRAEDEISRALKLDPEFSFSHLLLGHARFFQKEYLGSLKAYERTLEIDPSNAEAIKMVGQVRSQLRSTASEEVSP